MLDEDNLLDELLALDGAIELGATLEAGVLTAGFDVVGVGDPPPPPPPPQAVNNNVVPRQIVPIKKLVELFIVSPSFLSFWIRGLLTNVTGYFGQYTDAKCFQIVRLDLSSRKN
ncbi:MAG TPA: hypothetical protein DIW64_11060 [Cellvibrio sp.]|nr:hypothetical protein [Cellvibrio sp.]